MAKARCKESNRDAFFDNFLYERKVDKGQIAQVPYNPTIILKMLPFCYLWNVSVRMIEARANDSLSLGPFLGLGADGMVRDHSSLTLFKNRLVQNAGIKAYEGLFNEVIRMAQEKGVKFGKGLFQVQPKHNLSDTLGSDNGAFSVKAYSGKIPFGLRLPSPFNPCARHRLTPYPAL